MKQKEDRIWDKHNRNMFVAMEWGFKAHERGINLEMAMIEFKKILKVK